MNIIEGKNINKTFGELEILKNINIEIKASEIVAITGKSGAGKTTLLQILSSLLKPDKNPETQVIIDGQNIIEMKDRKISAFRNENIGFVFQFHQLLPEFSALENVMLPAFIKGTSKKEAKEKALELLEYLNVSHRNSHFPSEMSGGEQQRVAVARALINSPKVIFADEPSGNLDTKNAIELHDLFFKLRKEKKQTFVIVTHNQELAKSADRIIQMKDGEIVI